MKYFLVFLLSFCMMAGTASAFGKKHRDRGLPRTEVGLMTNVLGCLTNKDSISYFYLFPPFDTLWSMVMHNPDKSPETVKALNNLKEHPQTLLEFDPYYNHRIMGGFFKVLKKGEDSGIHWNSTVMQRYELYKQEIVTRDMSGYDKIAPERFRGYMFVRDILGRLTFCISISEIQKINGYFFGGQVTNILEASSMDEFYAREKEEQRYFDWLAKHPEADSANTDSLKKAIADSLTGKSDSAKQSLLSANATDDDVKQVRKEVIDRKYYEGKFDDEIAVKLFVRYMRVGKGGKPAVYDGLYKFGDQKEYVKLTITLGADGKWVMDDELPLGSMELELKNKVYTGTWLNNENQTGYDVVLTQTVIQPRKLEQLEAILERGLSGRVDDDSFEGGGKKPTPAARNTNIDGDGAPTEDAPKPNKEKPKEKKKKQKHEDDE